MTNSKCDSCGAPLNFALQKCSYCGSPINQKYGVAFPVRCPWNGARTCGVTTNKDSFGHPSHCAHCHANEPHPMSPEGSLVHDYRRWKEDHEERVCEFCFKVAVISSLEEEVFVDIIWSWKGNEFKTGLSKRYPNYSLCSDCATKFNEEIKRSNAKVEAEFKESQSRASVTPVETVRSHWWNRKPEAEGP